MGIHNPCATLRSSMELRIFEHPEPSHIHVPRPSRTIRGAELIHSACPADICAMLVDQHDERASLDSD